MSTDPIKINDGVTETRSIGRHGFLCPRATSGCRTSSILRYLREKCWGSFCGGVGRFARRGRKRLRHRVKWRRISQVFERDALGLKGLIRQRKVAC